MAITASVALSPTSAKIGQASVVTLTVNNSASTAVNVTGIAPTVLNAAGSSAVDALVGQPPITPGFSISVPGSGSATFQWSVTAGSPQAANYAANPFPSAGQGGAAITPLVSLAMPTSLVYTVGALVYTSDGSATSATTASLTVTPNNTY